MYWRPAFVDSREDTVAGIDCLTNPNEFFDQLLQRKLDY